MVYFLNRIINQFMMLQSLHIYLKQTNKYAIIFIKMLKYSLLYQIFTI